MIDALIAEALGPLAAFDLPLSPRARDLQIAELREHVDLIELYQRIRATGLVNADLAPLVARSSRRVERLVKQLSGKVAR